jgi:hypothetical protein
MEELNRLIGDIRADDIVLVEARLVPSCRPLFKLLASHGVRYAAVDLGALPQTRFHSLRSALSLTEYVMLRAEDLLGLLRRSKDLVRAMAAHGFEYFRLQPPALWLTAGTALSPRDSKLPMTRKSRRVPVASFDALTVMEATSRRPGEREVAVFLDEAFVDHPDFALVGVATPVTYQAYWSAMERLFRAIEAQTGLKVIVAPHPKSSGAAPAEIKARMAAAGQTAELVRDSRLVICHASTAVAFAVLFKRPLLFATTNEIEKSWYYRGTIARMSSCFRLRRVNADRFDLAALAIPPVNEDLYRQYEHAYLHAPGAKLMPAWAILREEVEAHSGRSTPRHNGDASAAAARMRQGVA